MISNRAQSLAKTAKSLMLKEPFYGIFLIMLNKIWDKRVPTAGVGLKGINYNLLINEDFWDILNDNQKIGLLKHELLHIGFFHLTDFGHQLNREISNIAQDIEINQYIAPEFLPPGPQLPSSYPELNLEPKKGCNYYYEKLMQAAQENPQSCKNLVLVLDGISRGESTITDSDGNPLQIPQHDRSEFEELPEATQKLIQKQTEFIIKSVAEQASKLAGSIPGEFVEILERINHKEPPKFDWRGYLRRFSGGSVKVYTKKTRRKYNKRYPDNPGLKIKQRKHIMVAIDTSGSVSTEELKEFMHEIHYMHKTGTEITIVQADTAISNIAKYKPDHEINIHGRGGTSFQPVIDYYNENTRKYTALIYFTDGEASTPTPAQGRILWVISSQSQMNEDLIGPKIHLN
jgi:predicted metal-dependent peptidase